MKKSKNLKYRYDEEEGIFIRESDISVNWVISQILERENAQITKISDEEVQKILHLLDISDFRLPDGTHGLVWLKEKLKEKFEMAGGKQGETWAAIADRYRFIMHHIDLTIVNSKNKDINEKIKEKKEKLYRTPNNMVARFEPEENEN